MVRAPWSVRAPWCHDCLSRVAPSVAEITSTLELPAPRRAACSNSTWVMSKLSQTDTRAALTPCLQHAMRQNLTIVALVACRAAISDHRSGAGCFGGGKTSERQTG